MKPKKGENQVLKADGDSNHFFRASAAEASKTPFNFLGKKIIDFDFD
jgi:hypothetical protein